MNKDYLVSEILGKVAIEPIAPGQQDSEHWIISIDDAYNDRAKSTLQQINYIVIDAISSIHEKLFKLCSKDVNPRTILTALIDRTKCTDKAAVSTESDDLSEQNQDITNQDDAADAVVQDLKDEINQEMASEPERELDIIDDLPGLLFNDREESEETEQQQDDHNVNLLPEKENCANDTLITVLRTALHEICTHSEKLEAKWRGVTPNDLLKMCSNADTIDKNMTIEVLKVLTKFMKCQSNLTSQFLLKNKTDYINVLSSPLGDG